MISVGFIVMKLDPAEYGLGFLALTVAPALVVLGFVVGILSIFHGTFSIDRIKYQLSFLIVGWATFIVSFIVYVITLEETASLWDCAEFIACAYKLQVPHAPGAPLFLMIGRLFSLFALGDKMMVAYWVNMTSAISSAVTVMFTFWSVVMLGKRIAPESSDFSLILAGIIGAFSIAFADSFWFSAVEAETYAMATMFLIICFWAILKWDQAANVKSANKWLIFILYLLGLSVGVHPMSLLILPAIAVIVVLKNKEFSRKQLFVAISVGALIILFLNHLVLFGLPDALKSADIFSVNVLGFPFYTGSIIIIILFIIIGYLGYWWSLKNQRKIISLSIVGLMYFLIGYSSYFMIIIRSQANPSIDEHNPENLVTLASYLKRESYGERPFLYGPNFTTKIKAYKKGNPIYSKGDKQYDITDCKTEYTYENEGQTIFPRMYSTQPNHVNTYREWVGLNEGEKPRFSDNLKFMFLYQFGHMYMRYFLFNFSGRASDIQDADWLGPFDYFEKLPESIIQNKARNNFFLLPFLLGVFGLLYQYRNDKTGFWAVMAFFLFFGFILVFYLNTPPNEPRERDYIYVGSYISFCIWIGLGAMGIYQLLKTKIQKYRWFKYSSVITILIPLLMFFEGFDDHNRSGRTLQVDHARNTLESCAPNAILFTGGDNDTFPLWYVQEVEGLRTDVRVIVLSYFNGDWYIDQMQRKVYQSEPLPFSLKSKHYKQGGLNDVLPYVENPNIKAAINLHRYLELVRDENKSLQVVMSGDTRYNSIPSRTFYMEINKEKILKSDLVPEKYLDQIPAKLNITWNGNYMEKSAFMALDLISTNNWERPIYFNMTSLNTIALDLQNHVLQEGLVYRFLPIHLENENELNLEKMYTNVMEKWKFQDLKCDNVYYSHEDYQLRILQPTKTCYNTLAVALLENDKTELASKVIGFLHSNLIKKNIDIDVSIVSTINILFRLKEENKAIYLAERVFLETDQQLQYLKSQNVINSRQGQIQLFILRQLAEMGTRFGQKDLAEKCTIKFNEYYTFLSRSSY